MAPTQVDYPPQLLGGTAIKPVERTKLETLRYFFYNPESGAILSRTPKSWFLIISFYIIFYLCLAGFWYGLLTAFFTYLPSDRPKWVLGESIIGTNPGVGLRPHQAEKLIDSSIIRLSGDVPSSGDFESDFQGLGNADWAKRYENFTNHYKNVDGTVECPDGEFNEKEKPCRFDVSNLLGPTCSEYPFGYLALTDEQSVAPCVLLKVNRIFDWVPLVFEDHEEIDAQNEFPQKIKDLLKANPNKVYFNCEGEMPYDREGLADLDVRYYPQDQGIDNKYFPYKFPEGNYQSPVVAVQFGNIERGRLYHIQCLLYGKGIEHNKRDRLGLVHFELLMD